MDDIPSLGEGVYVCGPWHAFRMTVLSNDVLFFNRAFTKLDVGKRGCQLFLQTDGNRYTLEWRLPRYEATTSARDFKSHSNYTRRVVCDILGLREDRLRTMPFVIDKSRFERALSRTLEGPWADEQDEQDESLLTSLYKRVRALFF